MITAGWNPSTADRWPWRRLLPALMASALAHYLIVDGWRAPGGAPQFPASIPYLQAQLEIPRAVMAETESVVAENLPLQPAIRPEPRQAPVAQAMPPAATVAEMRPPENSGDAVPDLRIYPARELDRYPVPLAPLDLRAVQGRSGMARFWVTIDISGYAIEAELITGDLPPALAASARGLLLAARFSPGFKDERPVKSRILLELRYGP